MAGSSAHSWDSLAEQYGLLTPFEITWLPTHPRLKRYDFAWQAVRAARAWGAQAVYTWVPQAALLALWQHTPALLELHDRPTGRIGPWIFRQVARHPGQKRLLFITQALRQVLEREQNVRVRPEEALIAPDGVDLERYANLPSAAEARRRLGLPEGLTAGYTGHLYPGRGMEVLVALARALPEVNFLWVGGRPSDVTQWRAQAAQMGLANITLTGFVPNARIPLYQAAGDILLMPYERSVSVSGGGNTADICSPMKMFEYMAAGRAILSSDLPVLHEVLDETSAVFARPKTRMPGWGHSSGWWRTPPGASACLPRPWPGSSPTPGRIAPAAPWRVWSSIPLHEKGRIESGYATEYKYKSLYPNTLVKNRYSGLPPFSKGGSGGHSPLH